MSNNLCQHEYLQSGGGVPRNCIYCGEPEFTLGQKSKTIMANQSAREIVNENFKGLDQLIEGKDLLQFYKDLIVACIESYHTSKLSELVAEDVSDLDSKEFDRELIKEIHEANPDLTPNQAQALGYVSGRKEKWVIYKLSAKIAALKKVIAEGAVMIAERNVEIAELKSQIAALNEVVYSPNSQLQAENIPSDEEIDKIACRISHQNYDGRYMCNLTGKEVRDKLSPVIAQLRGELKLVHIAHDFQADIVKQQDEICKKLLEEIYSIRSELSRLKAEKEELRKAINKSLPSVSNEYAYNILSEALTPKQKEDGNNE